jgi:hypothetical protein
VRLLHLAFLAACPEFRPGKVLAVRRADHLDIPGLPAPVYACNLTDERRGCQVAGNHNGTEALYK